MGYFLGTIGDDTIEGSEGDDYLYGGPNGDRYSGEGRDTLFGYGGNDFLYGGQNADKLYGGLGNDFLDGGSGDDQYFVSGTFGQDLVYDYSGSSTVYFTDLSTSDVTFEYDGNDLFIMKVGTSDRVAIDDYGYSSDSITLQFSNGIWLGGPTSGDDLLIGSYDIDVLDGLAGNDKIYGDYGNDELTGSAGNDILYGDEDDDHLTGGVGNDQLFGGSGTDSAGWGNDGGTGGLTIDLVLGTAKRGTETDTLSSIESINGSAYNDTINGDSIANTLGGGAGIDTINGREGNDTLAGGDGKDAMDGGAGVDTVTVAISGVAAKINLTADTVTRGTEIDRVFNIENAIGSNFVDEVRGDGAANRLDGLGGNDTIYGEGGDDILIGGVGKDTLVGGAGKDIFDFAKGDSGINANADLIKGFDSVGAVLGDRIDLIDVYSGLLLFKGTSAFSGVNQVRVVNEGSITVVEINLSGNLTAEMEIRIDDGAVAAPAWTALDFFL